MSAAPSGVKASRSGEKSSATWVTGVRFSRSTRVSECSPSSVAPMASRLPSALKDNCVGH
jgi:hypothetical protein